MEIGVFVLMLVFGVCIFLFGLQLCVSKHPYVPYRIQPSIPKRKSYLPYLGKIVMLVSLSPVLGGCVSLLGDSGLVMFLTVLTITGSFVGLILLGIKIFHEK